MKQNKLKEKKIEETMIPLSILRGRVFCGCSNSHSYYSSNRGLPICNFCGKEIIEG